MLPANPASSPGCVCLPESGRFPGSQAGETLAGALSDETLTSRLIDDLLASMLAVPQPAARRPKWHLAPVIPAAHGAAALATFLLAILAAVAAT